MPRKKAEKKPPQVEKKPPEEGIFFPEEVENNTEEEETLQSLGQKIREVRVSKNLSLESVSGHLHIALKILRALENGTPENVSSPVFIRGLARAYCKFLEMEETGIADKIDRLLKTENPNEQLNLKTLRPVQVVRESHPVRNTLTVLVLVIGGYLFYSLYFSQMPFFPISNNETQTEPLVVEAEPKIEPVQKITPAIQEPVIAAETPPAIPEVSTQVTLTVEKQAENQENIQPEVVKNTVETLVLEVEASEETWISIAVDGKETKDVRIRAEEIHQWEAKRQYLLTLGNTQVLRVLLNGREIETNRTNQLLTDWVIDASLIP